MHKKILRIACVLLILVSVISLLPATASSVATTEAERISALVTSTYKQALKKTGRKSFHGWCGAAVDWQMRILGITTKVVGTDGNVAPFLGPAQDTFGQHIAQRFGKQCQNVNSHGMYIQYYYSAAKIVF